MTQRASTGALPNGCCNSAPCRASQALLLIGCGASQASRDLKLGPPRCRGSGSATLAGRRAPWESHDFQSATHRTAPRQPCVPQNGSCCKGSWDSRFPQGDAPWCRDAQQPVLICQGASWESHDREHSAPCRVSRELLLIGQRALWASCELQHGSCHQSSWETAWGEDAPWCLQKCLVIGLGASGGSRDSQGAAPCRALGKSGDLPRGALCRAPWGGAEPGRALPTRGVSNVGCSPRHRLKRHWTRGSSRMEVEGAEPSRGFVFSCPRGRGLSRT